jgi:2'-5' RNA ligase
VIRAFVAIELPQNLKPAVLQLIENLQGLPDSDLIRWVKPQAFHLTLVFLGDVDSKRIPDLSSSLQAAASVNLPFQTSLAGMGAFPNWSRPRVLHLEIADPAGRLTALQHSVQSELEPLGFEPERRPFTPHLTLGRARNGVGRGALERLVQRVQKVGLPGTPAWSITDIHLIQSDLRPTGPVYTTLASLRLGS